MWLQVTRVGVKLKAKKAGGFRYENWPEWNRNSLHVCHYKPCYRQENCRLWNWLSTNETLPCVGEAKLYPLSIFSWNWKLNWHKTLTGEKCTHLLNTSFIQHHLNITYCVYHMLWISHTKEWGQINGKNVIFLY